MLANINLIFVILQYWYHGDTVFVVDTEIITSESMESNSGTDTSPKLY